MVDLSPPAWLDDPPPTGEGDYFGDVPLPTATPVNFFDQPPRPEPTAPLRIINPADLQFTTVPDRQWIVEDWLPVGTVTALYGDGGTGKTLLAQQLQTATATGRPWCGMEPMRIRSVGLYCEDDEDEMHRRQWSINRALGIDFSALGDMC